MQKTVNIPDYFNVKHYKDFSTLKSLDDMEQRLFVITALTGESMDTVLKWPIPAVIQVYSKLNELIVGVEPEFYPVIEWEGTKYGYNPMFKMTLDEYIDLDNLAKDAHNNINEILAILYRPVTSFKLDTGKFVAKQTLKVLTGKGVENGFDYYQVEKYDNEIRKERAKTYDTFPAAIALGALGFFLGSNHSLSKNTTSSILPWDLMMSEATMKKSKIKGALARTMVGYLSSTTLQKVPSYQSLGTNV